jgi:hypothetical protein
MSDLYISQNNNDFLKWSTGSSNFYSNCKNDPLLNYSYTLILAVNCCIGYENNMPLKAMLDTACRWSLISSVVADDIEKYLFPLPGTEKTIKTHHGSYKVPLFQCQIYLLADQGENVCINATVGVLPDEWGGPPVVIGYTGSLERIRFAIDPYYNGNEERIFFSEITET